MVSARGPHATRTLPICAYTINCYLAENATRALDNDIAGPLGQPGLSIDTLLIRSRVSETIQLASLLEVCAFF